MVNVRRSSDNATKDLGVGQTVVAAAELSAFIGGGTGFVTKLYDQSGNARDLVQATAANQPTISLLLNNRVGVVCNGSTQYMVTAGFTLNQPWAFNIVYRRVTDVGNAAQNAFDGLTGDRGTLYLSESNFTNGMYAGLTAPNLTGEWASPAQPIGTRGAVGGTFNGASAILRVNSSTITGATGNCGANNMDGLTLATQGGAGVTRFSNIEVQELLLFNTSHSAARLDSDNATMRTFWG
jgi:hypothetical protein